MTPDSRETPDNIAPLAERARRYHSELLRRDIECSECRARSFGEERPGETTGETCPGCMGPCGHCDEKEPTAPPLAPSSEPPDHVCGLSGYNGMIDPPCPACEYWKQRRTAPREPQPSSERVRVYCRECDEYYCKAHAPSSEASAPQTEERTQLVDILEEHCYKTDDIVRAFRALASHILGKQEAACSLLLWNGEVGTREDTGDYIDIASAEFEGDTFEDVKAQVEAWAQAMTDRAVAALRREFAAEAPKEKG